MHQAIIHFTAHYVHFNCTKSEFTKIEDSHHGEHIEAVSYEPGDIIADSILCRHTNATMVRLQTIEPEQERLLVEAIRLRDQSRGQARKEV